MKTLKFENLPNAVAEILKGQCELKALLLQKENSRIEVNSPLGIKDVAKLTGYTLPTLYGYCQRNEIPYHKKHNRLFFFKSEIIDWIRTGKQKTLKEIEADTDAYLSNHKKEQRHEK